MSRIACAVAGLMLTTAAVLFVSMSSPERSDATFPGSNGKIVYTFGSVSGGNIAVRDPDGDGYDELTSGPTLNSHPSWSSDGTQIVFAKPDGSFLPRIWIMNADGSDPVVVPGADVYGYYPSLSPDGNTVYFLKNLTLVKASTSGGTVTPLTATGDVGVLSISPDGSIAVYTRNGNQLFTISTDGSGTPQDLDVTGEYPSFSPDGQRIAFSAPNGGTIYTADTDGSNLTPLPQTGIEPQFSPDGQYIVWVQTGQGFTSVQPQGFASGNIWIMDVDGDNAHALSASPSTTEFAPDWQPVGGTPLTATPSPSPSLSASPTVTSSGEPTATPTGGPSSTATVTATPTGATPTATIDCSAPTVPQNAAVAPANTCVPASPTPGGATRTWGDDNCSGDAPDPVDSLVTLRHDAGLSTNTGECPDMGQVVEVGEASPHPWGDVDCSGEANPVDSLKLLRFDAGLNVDQPVGCPAIGDEVLVLLIGP